jgi:hypothetical protein
MIEVFNINKPGKSSSVRKDRYEEVKRVLKALMPDMNMEYSKTRT